MEARSNATQDYWDSVPHHYEDDETTRLAGAPSRERPGTGPTDCLAAPCSRRLVRWVRRWP
ncbi:hypothetical protein [Paractinoplanes durhamensis]|uniref:hypothetical protein n=1 Tax=Paractinoplanes durhamensis TaxID=113563 RepID=UPI00363E7ECC